MSYKSIDLQISIPRTPEAGGLHSQQMHKPAAEQNKLADDSARQTEMLRHKNTSVEETAALHVRDDSGGSSAKRGNKSRKKKMGEQEQGEQASVHPFKGKHIDISL